MSKDLTKRLEQAEAVVLREALTECERATWREGQTGKDEWRVISDIRRIAEKALTSDGTALAALVDAVITAYEQGAFMDRGLLDDLEQCRRCKGWGSNHAEWCHFGKIIRTMEVYNDQR